MAKIDSSDIDAQIAASVKKFSELAKNAPDRERAIIDMPEFIRNKAQMISAHMLLSDGARIVDMGCESGEVTYMLAALNPFVEVIGVDRDAKVIEYARQHYKLPNLSYRQEDIYIQGFEDETLDGIINSNILHDVYSVANYDLHVITQLLEKQIAKLKTGGTMLIRDYVKPPEDDMVLLELPDVPSKGDTPEEMSDADLLMLFSQTARPMEQGYEGFFIEEVAPEKEKTRLFRLPHKWAKEFIHRKDYRKGWAQELPVEYTFYTWQDYRRELTRLGMRMAFTAPYWNPWVVKNCYQGRFQMYDENYHPINPPPTNHFIVAQKVGEKQSLLIEERRPSTKPVGDLQIMVVRDKISGALHELVKRPGEYCDIVPYRITPDNRLMIYVRSGYPRPIINAVPRGSHNLDGKRWSGHLIEPITMDTINMSDDIEENRRMIFDFVERYAGLRPKSDDSWYVGDTYYPSPDRIDEAIEPVFIEVENPYKTSWPIQHDDEIAFSEIGTITELEAAQIVQASQVGLLPEPRLELHVFDLLAGYSLPFPRWVGEEVPKITGRAQNVSSPEELLQQVAQTDFEDVGTTPVSLKPVKAVFVEEGRVGGSTRGLSSQDVEFILTEEGIENIAVVVPLSRDWDDNVLVAMDPKIMPVPNRLGGEGAMINMPSFVLPRNVRTVDDAKVYLADIFRVPTEQVRQLGESYFTHTGVTPQRIYPFVVSAPAELESFSSWKFTPLKRLFRLLGPSFGIGKSAQSIFKLIGRLHMMMPENHDMVMGRSPISLKRKEFSLATGKTVVTARDTSYVAPSRILGQRGQGGEDAFMGDGAAAAAEEVESALFHGDAAEAENVDVEDATNSLENKLVQSYRRAAGHADDAPEQPVPPVAPSLPENKPPEKKPTPPALTPTPPRPDEPSPRQPWWKK